MLQQRKNIIAAFSIFTIVTILLISVLVVKTANAQETYRLNPNTSVSNTGETYLAPQVESGLVQSAPSRGTGMFAASSERIAEIQDLAPIQNGISPGSVIGADGRTKVTTNTTYPYRAIAYLAIRFPNGATGSCTGWFIGPRTVVTAGHCVHSKADGGWATITVYPGRNGAAVPYGSTSWHKIWSVTGWTVNNDPNYDYGAIQTNAAKGNTVGYFGYYWQLSNTFPGAFTVSGYPGDKPSATQWKMAGGLTAVTTRRLWYAIDTFGGQSGSPLYQARSGVCCYGYGVHTYGFPLFGRNYNSATRITQGVFNNLYAWKNSPYP